MTKSTRRALITQMAHPRMRNTRYFFRLRSLNSSLLKLDKNVSIHILLTTLSQTPACPRALPWAHRMTVPFLSRTLAKK